MKTLITIVIYLNEAANYSRFHRNDQNPYG